MPGHACASSVRAGTRRHSPDLGDDATVSVAVRSTSQAVRDTPSLVAAEMHSTSSWSSGATQPRPSGRGGGLAGWPLMRQDAAADTPELVEHVVTRPVEVLTTIGAATVGGLAAVLTIGASPLLALPGVAVVGLVALFTTRHR